MDWQNRIIGLEHRPARELLDHSGNWRTHPSHQADALAGVLKEVGIVDALLVYQSERQGGLTVIDGHLRKALDPDATWPCLMTNLTDTEADYVLATFDWLTYQAQADREQLRKLLVSIETEEPAVQGLLDKMESQFLAEIQLPNPDLPDEPDLKSEVLIEIRCSRSTLELIQNTILEWDMMYGDLQADIS